MATYSELFALRQNADLLNRVAVACTIAALAIMTEDAATELHAQRVKWAVAVFQSPETWAQSMIRVVLASVSTATLAQITGATDASIQAQVNASINLFASQL